MRAAVGWIHQRILLKVLRTLRWGWMTGVVNQNRLLLGGRPSRGSQKCGPLYVVLWGNLTPCPKSLPSN
eukprot:8788878-Ditylum_brightwellii.AAC.1